MSNSDVPLTLAHVLALDLKHRGTLSGRVLDEALSGGGEPPVPATGTLRSAATANGLVTLLRYQQIGALRYFDAAGFAGRTVGL
jgi:hypothetical protein